MKKLSYTGLLLLATIFEFAASIFFAILFIHDEELREIVAGVLGVGIAVLLWSFSYNPEMADEALRESKYLPK